MERSEITPENVGELTTTELTELWDDLVCWEATESPRHDSLMAAVEVEMTERTCRHQQE